MARITKAILGVMAASLTLGVAQLACGGDLIPKKTANTEIGTVVNRAAKADRVSASENRSSASPSTISVRVGDVPDMSVAIRLPAKKNEKLNTPVVARKSTVACEPVVSALTEVAKLLQPGRCFT